MFATVSSTGRAFVVAIPVLGFGLDDGAEGGDQADEQGGYEQQSFHFVSICLKRFFLSHYVALDGGWGGMGV